MAAGSDGEIGDSGADEALIPGLMPHLRELRRRLIWIGVIYLAGVVVVMHFSDAAFQFIARPIRAALPPGTPLVFLGAPDLFFTYLKIALVLAIFLTAPLTFYHFWAFVAPGLYRHERRLFLTLLGASLLLLTAGAAFAFFVVFPLIFHFFFGLATDGIQALPAVKEYLTLVLKLLFAFGLVFQIPLLVLLLVRLELVELAALTGKRRHVVVWAFIIAAILTPPDIISQTLLALPMLLLYEAGILAARLLGGR
ncbi:MAG: twin-arginine translocase subunit TatC [Zetaproteobacteria bacterium]|nr:MAG: twin-arginine translocase subunit TatC [Zetaproteobacteria bacterium]